MEDQSKKAWAFPHRSGDVPRGSGARNIDFALALRGLVHARAEATRGLSDPLNHLRKTQNTIGIGTGTGTGSINIGTGTMGLG